MEKLFFQILERKDRIKQQLDQHADSYKRQLASSLLIDGITPPSWLLNLNSINPSNNDISMFHSYKRQLASSLLIDGITPPPWLVNPSSSNPSNNDEICSPLSKKRKLDGLSGQECHPSKWSASSIDHRSGSTLFEQQLPNANFMLSSRKAGRTGSHNIKESTIDETINNGLVNEKPMEEDAERNSFVHDDDLNVIFEVNTSSKDISDIFEEEKHSEKSHLNEDLASLSKMQIEEGDLGHKGEGSTIGVFIPVSKSSESSLMTKQRNKDFEDPNLSKTNELAAEETVTKVDVEITEMDNELEQSEPASVLELIKPVADDSTYSLLEDIEPANPTSLIDVAVIDSKDDKIILPEWVTSSGSDCLSQIDDKSVIVSYDFHYSLAAGMRPEHPTNIDRFPVRDYKNSGNPKTIIHPKTNIDKVDSSLQNQQKFDLFPFTSTPFSWQSKNHHSSPLGKLWDRSASSSGYSEKQLSSNPELTCFPIEEDPGSNEESENAEYLSDELEDNGRSEVENEPVKSEDKRGSSIATRASSRWNVSAHSKNKSSMRNGIPRISQKGDKCSNIVSNITSFIPIVQKKQAAANCKVLEGKRDINVKALERAKALKEREQEKENARKAKKEALKLELERIRKQNARELEMKRKKKEKEEKERKADLAARKRQREEDEKKHLAKKRKVVTELQKNQKVPYENSRAGKVVLEKQQAKTASIAVNKKGSYNSSQNKKTDVISEQSKLTTEKTLEGVIPQVVSVTENRDASIDLCEKVHEMSPAKAGIVKLTGQEMSYDISPYQCSDDEDEDEEDLPNNKFVPSWASRDRVTVLLLLQQNIVPETIFPVERFCHMDEVFLPRRLQAQ